MIKHEISIPESIDEVSESLLDLIKAAKTALEDGWSVGDVPGLVTAGLGELPTIFEHAPDIAADIAADVPNAIRAVGIFLGDVAEVFLSE